MSHRYIEASEEAVDKTNEAIEKWFPALKLAVIKTLFDTRKRTKGNKIVLGQMMKANDLIRRLTDNLATEGCDYIMFLDQVVFTNISDTDKMRLIRHELRHCKVVGTEEKPKFKLVPHDISDFLIEVELNKDAPDWASQAASLALEIYDQIIDSQKEQEQPTISERPKKFLNRKK